MVLRHTLGCLGQKHKKHETPVSAISLIVSLQHEIQQGIACVFYVEQLVRHAQPELKEKRPRKKLLENLQDLGKVLRDLEVDLRTNPNDSWEKHCLVFVISTHFSCFQTSRHNPPLPNHYKFCYIMSFSLFPFSPVLFLSLSLLFSSSPTFTARPPL